MELNINEIASAKIQSMHESGEIRKRIEEGVEKSIYSAIDSACQDYQFRSTIEKKVLYLSLILSAHFVGRSFQKVNNSILKRSEANEYRFTSR